MLIWFRQWSPYPITLDMSFNILSMVDTIHNWNASLLANTAVCAWQLTQGRSLHGNFKQPNKNLTITFFWAAWKLTLCLYLLDHCAQTPHCTQQLDQNQPEKLLEDQKRVGTHSMAASPTSNTSESDVRFWIHSGRMCISMWKNDLSDFFPILVFLI